MNIKKGKLNYDHSGRAYPNNPRVKENWDSIWEYRGKYYKLVGDDEHKEWEQVNIYNQIIDESYENYEKITNNFQLENPIDDFIIKTLRGEMIKIETEDGDDYRILTQEEFIDKCKTDTEFSERWGLKIEERELSLEERAEYKKKRDGISRTFVSYTHQMLDNSNIPTKLITITYNNETIESYEH